MTQGITLSLETLYREIGWISLSDRRIYQKLIIMNKIHNRMVPSYLREIAPGLIRDNSNYNLRNANNFETLMRRTELFANSFIPSSVKVWNDLPINLRESPTLSNFKSNLLKYCFKGQTLF